MPGMTKAIIVTPKTIDTGKIKGVLKFVAGQKVIVVKTINENQVVIENDFGEKCSYLISQLNILK